MNNECFESLRHEEKSRFGDITFSRQRDTYTKQTPSIGSTHVLNLTQVVLESYLQSSHCARLWFAKAQRNALSDGRRSGCLRSCAVLSSASKVCVIIEKKEPTRDQMATLRVVWVLSSSSLLLHVILPLYMCFNILPTPNATSTCILFSLFRLSHSSVADCQSDTGVSKDQGCRPPPRHLLTLFFFLTCVVWFVHKHVPAMAQQIVKAIVSVMKDTSGACVSTIPPE